MKKNAHASLSVSFVAPLLLLAFLVILQYGCSSTASEVNLKISEHPGSLAVGDTSSALKVERRGASATGKTYWTEVDEFEIRSTDSSIVKPVGKMVLGVSPGEVTIRACQSKTDCSDPVSIVVN